MDPREFTPQGAGRLVDAPEGYKAFVPHPLPPPELPLNWELVRALSHADRALSELSGMVKALPNPEVLVSSFVRREALCSSRIEGTQASLSDLFFFEASREDDVDQEDFRHLTNYVEAVHMGMKRAAAHHVDVRMITELHAKLMHGIDRGHEGRIRATQNWTGPRGCSLNEARFVFPPPGEVPRLLAEFDAYLAGPRELPPLVRIALIHYQFEAIHPFVDGNGRLGRLLVNVLLASHHLLGEPLLCLSACFERRHQDYYEALQGVSQRGDWDTWIRFFLSAVEQQAQDATGRIVQLVDLWRRYREKLQKVHASALPLRLVDSLFGCPAITSTRAATLLGVKRRSAMAIIRKLTEAGILREERGRKRGIIFVARRIMDIAEAE